MISVLILMTSPAFCVVLPFLPSGRLGKSYENYGMLIPMAMSITRENGYEHSPQVYGIGMRSNLGLDLFDFGLLFEFASSGESGNGIMAVSADIKYGIIRSDTGLLSIDAGCSKALTDTWIFRLGPAFNVPVFNGAFDIVLSVFYQYNLKDCRSVLSTYNIHEFFPEGNSFYYYIGAEIPGVMPDTAICAGLGYLQIPIKTLPEEQAYAQLYLQFTGKFGLNPRRDGIISRKTAEVFEPVGVEPVEVFAGRARKYMGSGLYMKALEELALGLNAYPDEYLLNILTGNCYYKLGEKMKAYIYYRKALITNPYDSATVEFVKKLSRELGYAK